MRGGLRRVVVLGHDRGGGEHLDAGLADRDDMGAGAKIFQELDDVGDIVVEAKGAVGEADVARIVPVGDVDVVIGEQGLHGVAQKRGEMARQRRDDQHARLLDGDVLLEAQEGREGRHQRRLFRHLGFFIADQDGLDA